MARIVDPDSLNQATEVVFDTAAKTIQLLKAGSLSDDGVTLQALYSFCKEEWKSDSNLIKYPFPLVAITEQKFDLVNGWDFADVTTRNLIRDAGWALKDASNVSQEEYMGVKTLGTVGATDQIYYQQEARLTGVDADPTDFVLPGAANQAVKIYGDATHGDVDYRDYFKIFVREYQKLYDASQLSAIGATSVTYQVYAFPLSNSADLKVTHDDAFIAANAPYTGMTINWYDVAQTRDIGGTSRNFHIIIDGNGGTKEQIYEFVQYKLRQATDIDDAVGGTRTGKVTDRLLAFVGDTLITNPDKTLDWGVFIDDFAVADTNAIDFYDDLGVVRRFPYVAAGKLMFNENLVGDTDAIYRMYFTAGYGTGSALLVNDNGGDPISGLVGGLDEVTFDFDYENNNQGGRTPNQNAEVTVVAIGLSTGQFVKTTGTITRSNANSFSLVAALERNYSNPA
jgi:hypothetical protein